MRTHNHICNEKYFANKREWKRKEETNSNEEKKFLNVWWMNDLQRHKWRVLHTAKTQLAIFFHFSSLSWLLLWLSLALYAFERNAKRIKVFARTLIWLQLFFVSFSNVKNFSNELHVCLFCVPFFQRQKINYSLKYTSHSLTICSIQSDASLRMTSIFAILLCISVCVHEYGWVGSFWQKLNWLWINGNFNRLALCRNKMCFI